MIVEFVMEITHRVLIVLEFQMETQKLMNAEPVIMTQLMIVLKIVQVFGVEIL